MNQKIFTFKAALFFLFSLAIVLSPAFSFAYSPGILATEEAEGKAILEKLQAKQTDCSQLTDDNFEKIGEYFMGQTVASHESMNEMMEQMMGKAGEEQMHVVMGKRFTGCDPAAVFSQEGQNFLQMMPMMQMMSQPDLSQRDLGQGQTMMGSSWNMMGGWSGFNVVGWISLLLFWTFLVLGIAAFIRYLGSGRQGGRE